MADAFSPNTRAFKPWETLKHPGNRAQEPKNEVGRGAARDPHRWGGKADHEGHANLQPDNRQCSEGQDPPGPWTRSLEAASGMEGHLAGRLHSSIQAVAVINAADDGEGEAVVANLPSLAHKLADEAVEGHLLH